MAVRRNNYGGKPVTERAKQFNQGLDRTAAEAAKTIQEWANKLKTGRKHRDAVQSAVREAVEFSGFTVELRRKTAKRITAMLAQGGLAPERATELANDMSFSSRTMKDAFDRAKSYLAAKNG